MNWFFSIYIYCRVGSKNWETVIGRQFWRAIFENQISIAPEWDVTGNLHFLEEGNFASKGVGSQQTFKMVYRIQLKAHKLSIKLNICMYTYSMSHLGKGGLWLFLVITGTVMIRFPFNFYELFVHPFRIFSVEPIFKFLFMAGNIETWWLNNRSKSIDDSVLLRTSCFGKRRSKNHQFETESGVQSMRPWRPSSKKLAAPHSKPKRIVLRNEREKSIEVDLDAHRRARMADTEGVNMPSRRSYL